MGSKAVLNFGVWEILWIWSQFAVIVSAFSVSPTGDAATLANAALDNGFSIIGKSFTGASDCSGTYTDGPMGIDDGAILTTGDVTDAPLVNVEVRTHPNTNENTAGSALCNSIVGSSLTTYDAAVLTMNITVPLGYNGITAYFIFASEEYPKLVCVMSMKVLN